MEPLISITPPALKQRKETWALDPREATDYLEVLALLNGSANVNLLRNAIIIQDDEEGEGIGNEDAAWEDAQGQVEKIWRRRKQNLGQAYPFALNETGFLLTHLVEQNEVADAYRVCVLVTYMTRHGLLEANSFAAPKKELRTRVFQVLATLTVAGWARNCAVSVGWPRREKEAILAALDRARGWGSQLVPKAEPGYLANPDAKDGGVDVLGWGIVQGNALMPVSHWGQAASGENWKQKPIRFDVVNFVSDFLDGDPANKLHATIIPFDRDPADSENVWLEGKHGTIIDRLALPAHYVSAIELAGAGVMMDEIDHINEVSDWVSDVLIALRAHYA